MSKLRVLDLFSGIGGFSLGLERTGGFETVAFCEIEPFPRRVLAKHWPEVPCYDDVRTLTADRLRADGICVDVICGGFPCQDISVAGKGEGLAGARSGLWAQYARLVRELRPSFVLVENVAALLGRGLDQVLGDLAAFGFDAEWHCIPASAVGAPHERDRLWVVAYPNDGQRFRSVGAVRAGGHAVSGSREAVADANRLSGTQQQRHELRIGRQTDVASSYLRNRSAPDGNWNSEPGLGGGSDGVPLWLDRHVGRGLNYAESRRRAEVLRGLWSDHVSAALWRSAGGLDRISQAEVLFAFVREYEGGTDQARVLVAGTEASEDFLRSLRQRGEARSAPRRSGQKQQRAGEHSDVVQPMPRLLARDSEACWAPCGWEDATPRVAIGVPNRVDRLRGLGNAVVPQIPELIGHAILASLAKRAAA